LINPIINEYNKSEFKKQTAKTGVYSWHRIKAIVNKIPHSEKFLSKNDKFNIAIPFEGGE
jgi:hypothetical protein